MSPPISVLPIIYLTLQISCINSLKNVNNLQQFIATEKIEAEFYTTATYANIYDDCTQDATGMYLGDLNTATVLEYDQVNFGNGVQRVSLRVANTDPSAAVNIALRLTTSTSASFLAIPINPTGSKKCAFATVDVALDSFPTGTQKLFITIPSGPGSQLFLDWFQFNQTTGRIIPATDRIQVEDYDYAEDIVVNNNCSDVTVYITDYYSLLEYYQVDFGDGVQSVTVRLYTITYAPESVLFHTGSSSSKPFATVGFAYTGGSCNFSEVSADVTTLPTGVQNLFVTFDSGFSAFYDSFVFVRREGKWNATEKIEAENYSSAKNVSVYDDCDDPSITYVGALLSNSGLEYDGVDFGSGVAAVSIRVYSIYTGSPLDIELLLGSYTATPFVTVQVGQTGTERCDFYTVTVFLDTPPSGVQNLFFKFPSSKGGYLHLDWFSFSQEL